MGLCMMRHPEPPLLLGRTCRRTPFDAPCQRPHPVPYSAAARLVAANCARLGVPF
jgi:hypothetical protein